MYEESQRMLPLSSEEWMDVTTSINSIRVTSINSISSTTHIGCLATYTIAIFTTASTATTTTSNTTSRRKIIITCIASIRNKSAANTDTTQRTNSMISKVTLQYDMPFIISTTAVKVKGAAKEPCEKSKTAIMIVSDDNKSRIKDAAVFLHIISKNDNTKLINTRFGVENIYSVNEEFKIFDANSEN